MQLTSKSKFHNLSIMKRVLTFLAIVTFVIGALIVPSVHELHPHHCTPHTPMGAPCPDTCPICKVATTSIDIAYVYVAVVDIVQIIRDVSTSIPSIPLIFTADTKSARAPPRVA